MIERRSIPNLLTGTRLALVPVLWAFALAGSAGAVGAGMVVAWLTDALDGFLARRWHAESAWGSRFDSIADLLMFASGLAWLALLRPEFVRAYAIPLALWLGVGTLAYTIGWIRLRRVADVHLYSAKAANLLGFWLAAWVLALGAPPAPIPGLVIGLCLLAAVETLVAVSIYDPIDEHMVTILRRPGGSESGARRPRVPQTGRAEPPEEVPAGRTSENFRSNTQPEDVE
jgi:cardiolipin synthase (CMP-forming)